jgi:hypothetical protein
MKITLSRGNKIIKQFDDTKKEEVRMSKRERYINSLPSIADNTIVHSNKFTRNLINVPEAEFDASTGFIPEENDEDTTVINRVESPIKTTVTVTRVRESEIIEEEKVEAPAESSNVISPDDVVDKIPENTNSKARNIEDIVRDLEKIKQEEEYATVYSGDQIVKKEDDESNDKQVEELPSEKKEYEYDYSNIPVRGQPPRKRNKKFRRSDY